MGKEILDIIIIGAGPAGLTASLYAKRAMLDVLVIEKFCVGGQINLTERIENYPGFSNGIKSEQLVAQLQKQVTSIGVGIINDEVVQIVKREVDNLPAFKVITKNKKEYLSFSVIIATGAYPRPLGVKGEGELKGRGISYCAVCDGPLFRDKEVVVVGGGDKAAEEVLYLAKACKKVTLVHRRNQLRAAKILQDRIKAHKNIQLELEHIVTQIVGDTRVEALVLKNTKTLKEKKVSCDGVFIAIGNQPNTEFLKELVDLDEAGFIKTNSSLQTSVKGIFACGDVRVKHLRQVVTACGDGALASFMCQAYIELLGRE